MTAAASPRVYLLHFSQPYRGANGRHPQGARHYIGVALDGDVQRRVAEHLSGHGSPLVRAVVAAGIAVDLVLDVPGDRGLERRMHNRHGPRLCPCCRAQRLPRPCQLRLPIRRPAPRRRGAGVRPLWRLAHAA